MCERGKKLACMQKCMAQMQTSAVEEMQTRATKPLAGGVERLQWRYRKLNLRKALSGAGGPGLERFRIARTDATFRQRFCRPLTRA
jgi:hypothetical protein